MSGNKKNLSRNRYMLKGALKRKGYDWWWHSFTGRNKITGEEKTFFIEYFIINPAKSPREVVFGQSDIGNIIGNRSQNSLKPCYVMIKAGVWGNKAKQIHAFYPVKDLSIRRKDFQLKVGNCVLSENYISGSVEMSPLDAATHPEYMSASGSMSWNLRVDKQIAYNPGYGTSWLARKLNLFQMYWYAQGAKTEYSGKVFLDGVEYDVRAERSFGYADKNWGSDFTKPWIWLSSSDLISQISGRRLKNSCFDIGGGCPQVCGIPLKNKVLVFFQYENKSYEYNFSHFWKKSSVKFSFLEGERLLHWTVTAENSSSLLDVDIYCNVDDALFINYESPSGKKTFDRLWNCGCGYGEIKLFKKNRKTLELVEDAKVGHCGCEYGES